MPKTTRIPPEPHRDVHQHACDIHEITVCSNTLVYIYICIYKIIMCRCNKRCRVIMQTMTNSKGQHWRSIKTVLVAQWQCVRRTSASGVQWKPECFVVGVIVVKIYKHDSVKGSVAIGCNRQSLGMPTYFAIVKMVDFAVALKIYLHRYQ